MDPLRPAGFFVVRAPHLPLDELRRWSEGLRATAAATVGGDALEAAIAHDRALLRARLRALLERPAVREAIYVASPSLAKRMSKWLEEPEGKDGAKIEQAVVRYVARMAGRSTPFGLFASFSVGRVGDATEIELSAGGRRHVRFDMEYLALVGEALERDPAARARLRFAPSEALYEIAGRLHVPALVADGEARRYTLAAIDLDDPLRAALAAAQGGASRSEIARAIAGDCGALDAAEGYVDDLIDARVLVSALTPPLTGGDPAQAMATAMREIDDAQAGAAATLDRARQAMEDLEGEPLGAPASRYERVAEIARPLPAKSAHLLQVDMSRLARATLGPREVQTIARGVRALHALASPSRALDDFVRAFQARYEGREVPLMEALDDEVGIGFADPLAPAVEPTPLVTGLALRGRSGAETRGAWTRRSELLHAKLEQAWTTGAPTIALDDADVEALADGPRRPLPDSLAAFVTLLGARDGERDRRVVLHGYAGASAARALGRHAAWDENLARELRAHLGEEEARRPDAIFAEIAHLPAGSRAANLLVRPLLRDHEIAFCGRSGAPAERTLTVADLTISVHGGRVVLRSRRLGREIVPRLSSAHNFAARQLGVYRFLGALQEQGTAATCEWSWGPLESSRFLPRVELGEIVLAPRRWRLDEQEISRLAESTPAARFREAARLREARRLPRTIGLRDGDNVLPVDLENTLAVDALVAELKGRAGAILVELFHEERDVVVRGPDGGYANELVVPFMSGAAPAATPRPAPPRRPPPLPRARRQLTPGSEWLYAKIYCASGSRDHVLREVVRPVIDASMGREADGWFFLRFADPEPHLRLRVHGAPEAVLGGVLPRLRTALGPLLDAGRVHRLELGTYEREIERYGGDAGIGPCERIFGADSEAALRVVATLAGAREGRDRWGAALYGVHRLLVDFGLSLEARARVADDGRRAFYAEMGTTDDGEHAIAARYREERAHVEALLEDRDVPPALRAIFDHRSIALAPLAAQLHAAGQRLTMGLEGILSSLVHLSINRVVRARAREHELVLYAFLARAYASALARR
jgi:thiopeptide-type bacteriocin biosynthesis protein